MKRSYNVLFLCSANSVRSLMAEALLNHWGRGRFKGYSAGSNRSGWVHPFTLKLLQQVKLPHAELRSKDWVEFAHPDAPPMDFVITLCDRTAQAPYPTWRGTPLAASWRVDDPLFAEGDEKRRLAAFREAYRVLENRIKILVSLPIDSLDRLRLQAQLDDIGHSRTAEQTTASQQTASR